MIDLVVYEQYFVSLNKGHGASVVAEAIGNVKSSCYFPEIPLKYDGIPPPSWRSALNIKKDKSLKGSSQWKVPTKIQVQKILNIKFPDKIIDTMSGKKRNTPTDLVDSMGVCMGYLRKQNRSMEFEINEKVLENLTRL